MPDFSRLPPYYVSEVSSRMAAVDPGIARFFTLDDQDAPEMSIDALRQLVMASWLMGYAEGVGDAARGNLLPLPDELNH